MTRQTKLSQQTSATIATRVCAGLRSEILSGSLRPGHKLRIQDICKRFSVGLAPAREALNRLAAQSLVIHDDHRGFRVPLVSQDDLVDLTNLRHWVNEIALRQSIKNGDQSWEESVLLALYRMDRVPRFIGTVSLVPNPDWNPVHRIFHSTIIGACPSPRLLAYCEHLFDEADRYRNLAAIANVETTRATSLDSHHAIADAVLARHADEAVKLLHAHFQETCDNLLSKWESLSHMLSGSSPSTPAS